MDDFAFTAFYNAMCLKMCLSAALKLLVIYVPLLNEKGSKTHFMAVAIKASP